jgi:hypothetical protein
MALAQNNWLPCPWTTKEAVIASESYTLAIYTNYMLHPLDTFSYLTTSLHEGCRGWIDFLSWKFPQSVGFVISSRRRDPVYDDLEQSIRLAFILSPQDLINQRPSGVDYVITPWSEWPLMGPALRVGGNAVIWADLDKVPSWSKALAPCFDGILVHRPSLLLSTDSPTVLVMGWGFRGYLLPGNGGTTEETNLSTIQSNVDEIRARPVTSGIPDNFFEQLATLS